MLTFSFHADTHVGKQRTDNQDNFLCKSPIWGRKALALLAAIDGVGGYAGGEVAGFGGGGVHGYNSLEGTFLGGCIFSGHAAGKALARDL